MEEIEVKSLTKDYGHGRGIYDVSFTVHKGEVFGFLGPNGAGESTTMPHLMGFSKPQSGEALIHGLSCWKDHAKIMREVGYIPGEVALPEGLNGTRIFTDDAGTSVLDLQITMPLEMDTRAISTPVDETGNPLNLAGYSAQVTDNGMAPRPAIFI